MILVRFLNLKFLLEFATQNDRNFKFTALASNIPANAADKGGSRRRTMGQRPAAGQGIWRIRNMTGVAFLL